MLSTRWHVARLIVLAAVTAALAGPVLAGPPAILIEGAWARPGFAAAPARGATASQPSPARGGNSAVYFLVRNQGSVDDRLTSVSSALAARAEIHSTRIRAGIASMRPVPDILVPAGGATQLKPGGLHVMLVNLNRDLKVGDRVPIELRFARGGVVRVDVEVKLAAP
jgi:copper(I)-binding protein